MSMLHCWDLQLKNRKYQLESTMSEPYLNPQLSESWSVVWVSACQFEDAPRQVGTIDVGFPSVCCECFITMVNKETVSANGLAE